MSVSPAKNSLKALQILHRAMLMGMIIFAAVAFYLVYSKAIVASMQELDHTLQIIAVILCAAGFFIGNNFFKRKILYSTDQLPTPAKKISVYRSVAIIQWVLLEGPAIFSIICFIVTGNYAFVALAGTMMMLFAMTAPSKQKLILLLQLSENDLEEL